MIDIIPVQERSARIQGAGLPASAVRAAWDVPYGAFLVEDNVYGSHNTPLSSAEREGATVDPQTGVARKAGMAVGVEVGGRVVWRDGAPTQVDPVEIRAKAAEQAERLFARL